MESVPTATSKLTAKSIEELFPLIEFCRAGDLRQVAEWIQQGKPLNPPPGKKTKRRTPLQVAIEKGFLTLAENLLEAGADPMASGNALRFAIDHRRADIAALLIDRGSAVDPDLFIWACSSGDPETMRVFLARGADPIKGFPFYHAFISCLQPALGVYKEYVEKIPELREQADMALCHYAKEGNLRCVSLLLWAGARPDREVLNAANPDQEYRNYCALVEAASAGHVDVLRRMKPENFPEMHEALVGACWHQNTGAIMELLQKTNVNLQMTQESATRSLEHLLWQLGCTRRGLHDLRAALHAGHAAHEPECRFLHREVFFFGDELDDVARRAARHAMEESLRLSDAKARVVVVVERAEAHMVVALFFERDTVPLDHRHDVGCLLDRVEVDLHVSSSNGSHATSAVINCART